VLLLNECFVVTVYFVIDSVRKRLDTLSYKRRLNPHVSSPCPFNQKCENFSYRNQSLNRKNIQSALNSLISFILICL